MTFVSALSRHPGESRDPMNRLVFMHALAVSASIERAYWIPAFAGMTGEGEKVGVWMEHAA